MKDCIWPSLWWKGYFPPFDWVPRDSAVKTETKPLIAGRHHITLNKCYIWIISSLEMKQNRSIEMCSERNSENGNHDHRSPISWVRRKASTAVAIDGKSKFHYSIFITWLSGWNIIYASELRYFYVPYSMKDLTVMIMENAF